MISSIFPFPLSPFLFFLPRSSLFAIFPSLSPFFSSFLCSFFYSPLIPSSLPHSPPNLTFSLFLTSLSSSSCHLLPSFLPSPPFPFFFLLRFPFQHSTISPTLSLSLQSFLLPSSFPRFLPSSPLSVRTTYSTEWLTNHLSLYLSPCQPVQ